MSKDSGFSITAGGVDNPIADEIGKETRERLKEFESKSVRLAHAMHTVNKVAATIAALSDLPREVILTLREEHSQALAWLVEAARQHFSVPFSDLEKIDGILDEEEQKLEEKLFHQQMGEMLLRKMLRNAPTDKPN